MSIPPFTIIKKAGLEPRYTFQETVIDYYLDVQIIRDIYFQLSGQNFKIGQASCKAFPRKADLIQECQRLITSYTTDPKLWDSTLAAQEKKRIAREKAAAKKAEKAAILKARIDEKVVLLNAMTDEEFSILQKAIALTVRHTRCTEESDSE
jgi:hypothetical protein